MKRYDLELTATGQVMEERKEGAFVPISEVNGLADTAMKMGDRCQLLTDLPARLNKDAVVILEIGNEKPYFEAAFPDLPVFWLDTSSGDEQVLLITEESLRHWSNGDTAALKL